MSNDLVELDFSLQKDVCSDDLMETILTARVIPGGETSPLKFGQLQSLDLRGTNVGRRTIELIVKNLPQLANLKLLSCDNITDTAITALIGDEHDDIKYPYPALPNLTRLDLFGCPITEKGLIELSKSQLLDQLEGLSIYLKNRPQSNVHRDAILKTPLFSNMKSIFFPKSRDQPAIDTTSLPHLDNCNVWADW